MTDIVLNAPDAKLLVRYILANIKQYLYTLEFQCCVYQNAFILSIFEKAYFFDVKYP